MFVLPDADIWSIQDRKRCADYWDQECAKLENILGNGKLRNIPPKDFTAFHKMAQFAPLVAEILAVIADRVQPRDFDEFTEYGFDDTDGDEPPAST